ncbi:MAG: glutaminyl-peptide cyclotransferase [Rikenellaceae bacterium]
MKRFIVSRAVLILLFALVNISCGSQSGAKADQIIRTVQPNSSATYKAGDKITFSFTAISKIDSAQLFINDSYVMSNKSRTFSYKTDALALPGMQSYKIIAYRKGKFHEKKGRFKLLPSTEPKHATPTVKANINRSRDSYTQGLEFYDGRLYESSGEYGKSYIKMMEFPTLKTIKRVDLEDEYFAEGLTILNDKLYLLTWQEHKAFVYDAKTLELITEHRYDSDGWGLTNDGEYLYMSDGSSFIYKIEPKTFKTVERIEVLTPEGGMININELEWIDGKIWANVYGYEMILVINPTSGVVEYILHCNDLLRPEEKDVTTDVLNGIARNPKDGKVYITGKNWPKIFLID